MEANSKNYFLAYDTILFEKYFYKERRKEKR